MYFYLAVKLETISMYYLYVSLAFKESSNLLIHSLYC